LFLLPVEAVAGDCNFDISLLDILDEFLPIEL